MKKRDRSILVIIVGAIAMYQFIKQADHWTILDVFIDIILGILVIVVFTWAIYKDLKENKHNTFKSIRTPGIFIIGFIITGTILSLRDNSPVILTADIKEDLGSTSIDFRKDGTYKLSSYSILSADFFRGNYTIKDSIITLDRSEIDGIIKSNRLVIRTGNSERNEKEIYQLDAESNVLTNTSVFFINNKQASR
ncbi:hypothetical protein SAMN04488505_1174 [Chitinophaga rupis]|uniref:Uncharacterized protein n=1 Tax=Chitinophaga rupis TaxID=573321 RepID=A0A1H8KK39_9BACT|nr:hypothetical protein [Chitinophaga rupis]SEN93051.1 hypothetical protein SAMN04488505_1174 [Chitinophaga rupis]